MDFRLSPAARGGAAGFCLELSGPGAEGTGGMRHSRASGDPEIVRAVEKLSDFLTRIQVRSESVKDVDGAWFRAFNFRDWNYWASDADSGWGASSTLTGWIQSWIVVTQALMEEGTSYWDETSGSGTGKYDKDVFDEMLK